LEISRGVARCTREHFYLWPGGTSTIGKVNFCIFLSRSLIVQRAHGRKFGGTRVKCQDEAITGARILN
jgi:hypothetical protein